MEEPFYSEQHKLYNRYYKSLFDDTGLSSYLGNKYNFNFDSFTETSITLSINSLTRFYYQNLLSEIGTANCKTLEEKVSAINKDIYLNKYIKAEIVYDNKIDDERDYIRLEIRKKDIDRMIIYYKILLKHD